MKNIIKARRNIQTEIIKIDIFYNRVFRLFDIQFLIKSYRTNIS
jgi:hypothetical protein